MRLAWILVIAMGLPAAPPLPPIMLWAWETPHDLRFLKSPQIGVAYLATTLLLREDTLWVRRRIQPLRIDPSTPLVAVIRIESDEARRAVLSPRQRRMAADRIVEVIDTTGAQALQLDFDAKLSERQFYRLLLLDLRRRLGSGFFLSMTALVSWCGSPSWLADLPVDETIPMLFRMGDEGPATRYRLFNGGDFPALQCRTSLGLSIDEPRPLAGKIRRRYYFCSRHWTPTDIERILEENRVTAK